MTDREKYRTRGGYFLAIKDYKAAVDEYTKLLKDYPADFVARNNLGIAYFGIHDLKRAAAETHQASEIYPKIVVTRNNAAMYEMYAGEFDKAELDAQDALNLSPTYVKAYVIAALSDLAQDHADRAAGTYSKMKTISTAAATQADIGLADIAFTEGRIKDGMAILEGGLSADQVNSNFDAAARKLTMLAYAQRLLGDGEKALSFADRAIVLAKQEPVLISAAGIYAEENRPQSATAQLSALRNAAAENTKANVAIIEGEIRLKSRDFDQAVNFFRNAISYYDPWLAHYELGMAYLEKGAFPEASSEFETCVKRRGEAADLFHDEIPTFYLYPAAYYYLALAQEGMGSSSAAAGSFREFLSFQLKSNESPLASDARRRLASF
jgi:tetratricopeptide (TPR) repeat protein